MMQYSFLAIMDTGYMCYHCLNVRQADTDSGSSGAPVLDYDGRVVALHHKNVSASGRENQGQVFA